MDFPPLLVKALVSKPDEIIRIFFGTFAGAALAFVATRYHDASRRRQQNIAAGTMALISIVRQLREFRRFRDNFFEDVLSIERTSRTPLYLMARPTLQAYAANEVDVATLIFLLRDEGANDAINSIEHANLLFMSLVKLIDLKNETIVELQKKLAAAEVAANGPLGTEYAIRTAIGPYLVATTESLILSMADHAISDETIYQKAFSELRARLTVSLVPWWVPKRMSAWYQEHLRNPVLIGVVDKQIGGLPPMPKVIQRALDAQKNPAPTLTLRSYGEIPGPIILKFRGNPIPCR